jgi:hypothetical protein
MQLFYIKMKKIIVSLSILVTLFSSCKKEDHTHISSEIDPNRSGYITLEFDNRVGSLGLVLDSPFYTNSFNQRYAINKFDYFISNIIFVNADGSNYIVPQDSSYFLIKENLAASREITLRIPEGNYTGVKFVLGVDSLRNTKPANERTGVLDVGGAAAGMYWTWNSGYIFLKMEGKFDDPTDTIPSSSDYIFHIGGFGGYSSPTINNLKNISLAFGTENAEVRAAHGTDGPMVHMYVDAGKLVDGSTKVNFTTNAVVMFSPFSINIANNYAGMFTVDHVHNHDH